MKIITILLMTIIIFTCSAQKKDQVWDEPEVSPALIGGYDSLSMATSDLTVLPSGCNPGKVFIQFIINTDGSVENAKVIRSLCSKADSIALNIISSLMFIPGKSKQQPVRVKKIYPIEFRQKN